MSVKLIAVFLLFAALSIYLAFLNPHEIDFRLTQTRSLHVPAIVLLLGSVLAGVAVASLFNWFFVIRELPRRLRETLKNNRRERQRRREEKLREQAENALATGRCRKAESLFRKILASNPGHAISLRCLGDLMKNAGKHDEAADLREKAVRLEPGNIAALYGLAESHAAAGRYDKERETLKTALELDKNCVETLRKMRDSWINSQEWEPARDVQKDILRLIQTPDLEKEQNRFGEILFSNGRRFYNKGDVEAAKVEFKRAIRENDRSLPAYVALGDLYFEENRRKEALKIWKSGYSNTKSPVCLQRIQQVYEIDGFQDLVKFYEGAIRSASDSEKDSLTALLGTLLLEKGESEKAAKILENVADDSPLALHILLVAARQARNGNGHLPDASRSIFSKTRQSLFKFACRECRSSLNRWSPHCPSCKSWDSVTWGPVS